jgi:hypothetical protein
LAHRYQIDRNPEFIPPWTVLATGRIPTKAAELMVLLDCVRQVSACAVAYYRDVYRSLQPVLVPSDEPLVQLGVATGDAADEERLRLAKEMTARMVALGVDMSDAVFAEFKCKPLEAVV